MEYLSDWPFQGTFLETPYGNLIGRELEVPTVQGAITGLPRSYRGYRRDTPPPALTVVYGQAKEIEAVARNLFTHGPSFFSRFDESGPSQKDKNYLPSKSIPARNLTWLCLPKPEPYMGSELGEKPHVPTFRSDIPEKRDLNLVLSFLRARPR